MHEPRKRVNLIDTIRSNILANSKVKNKERAVEIAREWVKKHSE